MIEMDCKLNNILFKQQRIGKYDEQRYRKRGDCLLR